MQHNIDSLFVPAKAKAEDQEKISRPPLSAFQDSWIRLKQNKAAMISLFILAILVILAIIGPWLTSYSYFATDYSVAFQKPNAEHWFGTDKFGRDQWARVWYGTRISLLIAVLAAALDLIVGVAYGAISAIAGGKVDNVMQRIVEILIGVPSLIIIILLLMIMKADIFTIMIAMSITGWVNMARLVRAQVLKLKSQEFVLAARTLGTSGTRIVFKHMIPNTIGIVVINTMFTIPTAIFTEAFLSFIGLGLQAPKASLGVLIQDGFQMINSHYYLLMMPVVVIVALMVTFNILGDGLRDALDPRMRK
ncbi:ABC transporter permease [Paenibacillus sepulcri]